MIRWDRIKTPQRLQERLREAAGQPAPYHIDGDESRDRTRKGGTPAAVLIGLVPRDFGLALLLTRRTAHLAAHAGQISFPGGRMEDIDANAAAAALRETEEEIGLAPERVEVLGGMRHYDTTTGFRVYPIVGWVQPPVSFTIDPFEVEELFEVPLAFILDRSNHRRDSLIRDGKRRSFWAIQYRDYYIWGATAGMLVSFAGLLEA